MNTEEIIRNIEPRYTVVKNKDLSKDATVYYHEDDVKKAIAKALTLGNVSQQREQLIDFCAKLELKAKQYSYLIPDEDFIDEYLKDN
jgi:hypothetical protein